MDELRKRKNVLHPFMIERCEDLQPWEEVYHFLFFYILFYFFIFYFVVQFCVCVFLSQLTFINKFVMCYVQDSSRRWKCIDKIFCGFELDNFMITSSHTRCKFPWYNDITVDRTFWEALLCCDEKRIGWLLDEVSKNIYCNL